MEAVRVKKSMLGLVLAVVMLLLAAPGAAFASTPPSVELGSPQQSDLGWYFPNVEVYNGVSDSDTSVAPKTLTVSVTGAGTIDGTSKAVTVDAASKSATFNVSSAYDAKMHLRTIYFTGCNMTTTITVTVDANEATDITTLPTGTTLTQVGDHYYMYVPAKLSWTAAYNAAKSYRYNGMQGYLATITSDAEYEALHNRVGSKSGWIGGTLMLKSDYSKINDDAELNRVAGAFVYKADAAYDNTKATAIKDYYWACGPEAGQSVTIDTHSVDEPNAFQHTGSDQPWSGMDNTLGMTKYECCLTANNEGDKVINDITESGYSASGYADGYFVEFGGYESDPGQPDANKTKTVEYTFTHTHDLTYSLSDEGNQIMVKCANTSDGLCTIPADGLTLTLLEGDKEYYDGETVEALGTSDERSAWTAAGLDFPEVTITHSDTEGGTYSTVEQVRNAGYYEIEVSVGGVTASTTYSIGKRPCAVTTLKVKDKVYDGNMTANLDASGTNFWGDISGDDLNVTAKCTFSDKNVGKDKTVTVSNIELTGQDACNYSLLDSSEAREVKASITAREAELDWSDTAFTYDGGAHAPSCAVKNAVTGNKVSVVVSGAQTKAGESYTATASLEGADADNYELPEDPTTTFSIAQREVTLTWGSDELVYNGANQAPTCTLGNVVEDDEVDVAVIGDGPYAGKVCRATADSLTGAAAGNYKLPATGLTKDFTITKREVTLEWGETSFTYDGEEHVPSCTLGNLVGGDKVNVTVTGGQIDAGENLTATATKLDTSNYKLPATGTTTTFTIAKAAITPTVSIEGWTYGDDAKAPAVSGNLGDGKVTYEYAVRSDEDAQSEDSWSIEAPTAAGEYTVRATIAATDNYQGAVVTADFTIAQREVTLTWDETPLTYNGAEQAPACTAGNLVEGDTVKVTVKGAKTDAGEGYSATAASLDNANYKLPATGTTVTFSIAPKSIEGAKVVLGPSLTANAKEQEQTVESVTLADGTVLAAGDFTVSGNRVTDAGTYKLTVTGTGNYTGTVEAEFTIAAAPDRKDTDGRGDSKKKPDRKTIPATGDDTAVLVAIVTATGTAIAAAGAAVLRRTTA